MSNKHHEPNSQNRGNLAIAKSNLKTHCDWIIASYRWLDPKQKILVVVALSLIFALIIALLYAIFHKEPRPLSEYMKDSENVLFIDESAGEITNPGLTLRDQLGDEVYDQAVLGIRPNPKEAGKASTNNLKLTPEEKAEDEREYAINNFESSVEVSKKVIQHVREEHEAVRQMGGIAEVSELRQKRTGNVTNPHLAKEIENSINEIAGRDPNEVQGGDTIAQANNDIVDYSQMDKIDTDALSDSINVE